MANTEAALKDLEEQLQEMKVENPHDSEKNAKGPGELWSVRINSGLFHVPWEETKRVLEGGGIDVVVVTPQVEVNVNQDAQRDWKRRRSAEVKSKRGKRPHPAKAAISDEMAKVSEDKPMRRNDLRSRVGHGEAVILEGIDAAEDVGAESGVEPSGHPKKTQ